MATIAEPAVHGALPASLSARWVGLGLGSVPAGERSCPSRAAVHVLTVHGGRATYQHRIVAFDAAAHLPRADAGRAATGVVAFAGSVFALASSAAIELTSDLHAARVVDLAGGGRAITALPKLDALTGELHLLARDRSAAHWHITVSRGLRTRTTRAIEDGPGPLRDLAVTGDAVLVVSDDHVGVTSRRGDGGFRWAPHAATRPVAVHAYDAGNDVIMLCLTPRLERWTIRVPGRTVDRQVLDAMPVDFAAVDQSRPSCAGRYAWTAAGTTVARHDLRVGHHQRVDLGAPNRVGDLAFVADPARARLEDGGWLMAMVPGGAAHSGVLVVLDAAVTRAPLAVVAVPRASGSAGPRGWLAPGRTHI